MRFRARDVALCFTSAGRSAETGLGGTGALLALPGAGATVGLCPLDCGSHLEKTASFMGSGAAACGQLVDSSWTGCHQGDNSEHLNFLVSMPGVRMLAISGFHLEKSASRNPAPGARARGLYLRLLRSPV